MKIAVLGFNLLSSVKSLMVLTVLVLLGTGASYSQTKHYGDSIMYESHIGNSYMALNEHDGNYATFTSNGGNANIIIKLNVVAPKGTEIKFYIGPGGGNQKHNSGTISASFTSDFASSTPKTVSATTLARTDSIVVTDDRGALYVKVTGHKNFKLDAVEFTVKVEERNLIITNPHIYQRVINL
ncbi:MAG: hypothetical protein R3243_15400 [Arenibacter latericius]|nr:hypothetical protein [Arenibacter latericius]